MHKQRLYSRARALGTIVVALLLQASSPYPGGCGSDVRRSYAYVAPHCDADGVSPAGCVVTPLRRRWKDWSLPVSTRGVTVTHVFGDLGHRR